MDWASNMVADNGVYALDNAIECINKLENLLDLPLPDGRMVVVNNPEIKTLILHTCLHIGTAWKSLFDNGQGETCSWLKKAKQMRFSEVMQHLEGIDISPLSGLDIRNKVVHFEDHILKTARRLPGTSWVADLGLSHRDAFKSKDESDLTYCRVFIFTEGKLLHLGSEFDLYSYRAQAQMVVDRLTV